jgi:hypothetical protein
VLDARRRRRQGVVGAAELSAAGSGFEMDTETAPHRLVAQAHPVRDLPERQASGRKSKENFVGRSKALTLLSDHRRNANGHGARLEQVAGNADVGSNPLEPAKEGTELKLRAFSIVRPLEPDARPNPKADGSLRSPSRRAYGRYRKGELSASGGSCPVQLRLIEASCSRRSRVGATKRYVFGPTSVTSVTAVSPT